MMAVQAALYRQLAVETLYRAYGDTTGTNDISVQGAHGKQLGNALLVHTNLLHVSCHLEIDVSVLSPVPVMTFGWRQCCVCLAG